METRSSKTRRREFTYQQINHASNQVAHHLLEKRVGRGNVVMIYAHRGVDLVRLLKLMEFQLSKLIPVRSLLFSVC